MTRINHSFKRQPSTSLSCIDGKKQNNTQLDCIHQNNPAKQEGGDPTKMDKTNHNGSFKILYLKQTLSHRVNLRETIYSFMRKLILVKHLHVHGNPGSRNPTVLHYSQGKKKKTYYDNYKSSDSHWTSIFGCNRNLLNLRHFSDSFVWLCCCREKTCTTAIW